MAGEQLTLEDRQGRVYHVTNQSADAYRLQQLLTGGFQPSGFVCCRLGIPLIGGELHELRVKCDGSNAEALAVLPEAPGRLTADAETSIDTIEQLQAQLTDAQHMIINERERRLAALEALRHAQTWDLRDGGEHGGLTLKMVRNNGKWVQARVLAQLREILEGTTNEQ